MSMSNQVQRLTAALGDADGFAGRNVAPSDRQPSRDSYVLEEYGGCEKKAGEHGSPAWRSENATET